MRIELAFSHGTDGNSPVVDEHGMRPLASEMRSLGRLSGQWSVSGLSVL